MTVKILTLVKTIAKQNSYSKRANKRNLQAEKFYKRNELHAYVVS